LRKVSVNDSRQIYLRLAYRFLPLRVFDRIVDKFESNKHVRSFTRWNQMLCMVGWVPKA